MSNLSKIEELKEGVLAEVLSQTIDLQQAVAELPKELDKALGGTLEQLQEKLEHAESLVSQSQVQSTHDFNTLKLEIINCIEGKAFKQRNNRTKIYLIISIFCMLITICSLTYLFYNQIESSNNHKKVVRTLVIQDRALNALPQSVQKQFLDEYAKQLIKEEKDN